METINDLMRKFEKSTDKLIEGLGDGVYIVATKSEEWLGQQKLIYKDNIGSL